jgi:hypothetical protein
MGESCFSLPHCMGMLTIWIDFESGSGQMHGEMANERGRVCGASKETLPSGTLMLLLKKHQDELYCKVTHRH